MKKNDDLIGDKIKSFRKSIGFTLLGFARSISLNSAGQVSGWEKNQHLPSFSNILKIKSVHGLDLTSDETIQNQNQQFNSIYSKKQNSASGNTQNDQQFFIFLNENGEKIERYLIPKGFLKLLDISIQPYEVLLFNAVGDSMSPDIVENEKLLLDPSLVSIQDGAIYVVQTKNATYMRRLSIKDDSICLIPQNPVYPKRFVAENELKILGRVIKKINIS